MSRRQAQEEEALPASVVLHSCCAPCSAAILEWMLERGLRPVVHYCNPNIYPLDEYLHRKDELTRYAHGLGLTVVDDDYDHALWQRFVRGLEGEPERGARCLKCFQFRLLSTARLAHRLGATHFTTTLASSRWKRLDQIEAAGEWAAQQTPGTLFWGRNWRRGGLQERRAALLRQERFYNQTYCGCEFSLRG